MRAGLRRGFRGISIHAPRTGSDSAITCFPACPLHFNPRSPHGERRFWCWWTWCCTSSFQSTLPARGATKSSPVGRGFRAISIHAPRTGSDARKNSSASMPCYFNPRSPHGERLTYGNVVLNAEAFQSTLPARGATRNVRFALHMAAFQSTLPARGATQRSGDSQRAGEISIHAPRTGSDINVEGHDLQITHFNPRSPHGERQCWHILSAKYTAFQSTLPARGATYADTDSCKFIKSISIHAPRTGSDIRLQFCPPHIDISIHAPRTGSDGRVIRPAFYASIISIHAPRTGSDGAPYITNGRAFSISIHAPRTGSDAKLRCIDC